MKAKSTFTQSNKPDPVLFTPGNLLTTTSNDESARIVVLVTNRNGSEPDCFSGVVLAGEKNIGYHSASYIRSSFKQYHGTVTLEV